MPLHTTKDELKIQKIKIRDIQVHLQFINDLSTLCLKTKQHILKQPWDIQHILNINLKLRNIQVKTDQMLTEKQTSTFLQESQTCYKAAKTQKYQ